MSLEKKEKISEKVSLLNIQNNERIVRKYYQVFCALGAGLMLTCIGFCGPASGFLIPQLEDPKVGFGITTEDGSWIASILVVGSITGSLCGGIQSDRLGRKKSLQIDSLVFTFATLSIAFSPNLPIVLIGRFVQGHSQASSRVACSTYISETSQSAIRTYTGLLTAMCYNVAFALAFIFGALLPWRYAIGITALGPLASFIILQFCPESPTWLLYNGQEEQAKMALIKLRGEQNLDIVEPEFKRMFMNYKTEPKEQSKMEGIKNGLTLLTDPSFLVPFGVLCMLFIVGFNLTGLPVIAFYMIPLLLEAEIHIEPYLAAALLATWRGIMSLIGTPLIGRFKKRTVYFGCGIILTIGLLSLSAFTFFNQDSGLVHNHPSLGWIPIISILLIYTSISFGWLSISFQLRGELLPGKVRSIGNGLLGFLEYLTLFVVTKSVPTWFETLGVHGIFFMSACFTIGLMVFSFFFMPETTGLTLEEIEEMYRPKRER